jgi:hypothetical protein
MKCPRCGGVFIVGAYSERQCLQCGFAPTTEAERQALRVALAAVADEVTSERDSGAAAAQEARPSRR